MRTQIPGSQVKDSTIETVDLEDLSVTEPKLDATGVAAGSYTKVTVSTKGRVFAGSNPATLADAGITVNLDDLADVVLTSPAPNSVLAFDGTNWINQPPEDVDGSLRLYSENPQPATTGPVAAASGFNSVALLGGAESGASNSLAIGDQSLTRIEGSLSFANGKFGQQGDAQKGTYLLRSHSVNSNPTELFIDGTNGSARLSVPDDSTWVFEVTVVAHETNTANPGHAGFKFKGVIFKAGVNTAILGGISKETVASNLGWDCSVTADNTNESLKITVTGEAGKIIRWFATVETIEVTN